MKQRIITGVVAGALFIIFLVLGNLPFTLLVYALAAVAIYELLKMKNIQIYSIPGILALLITFSLLLPKAITLNFLEASVYTKLDFLLIGVILLLIYSVLVKNHFTFDDVGFILLSTVYVGMGFYYLIETRNGGLEYLIFALLIVWTTDSGAYFIGRKLGKKKLWPEISPNKTVEGFVGGIITAVVFASIMQMIFPISSSWIALIVIAIIASIFGQMGDLVESAIKRHYGVKDSGNLLPGHGGILDRFDSLLFVLPLLHFLQLI
ncbi:phosphatidate cytidylyltransferase [Ureibacillus chungkukjangi]|uniref:Phosphatidate cytidylyltransferase n=1 Tax=Ureibacillus chungkukjangi TaxID=1202712 RepID=A0A318TJC0_9BACL|nr:phosphatidate cytidylyltransferase [Ureibacillus chungkukjangi]MCM3386785.1 phosphatidate cytidylyltransferase [Ureibacillus chungkukjangi]PYF04734.1 phosphatidate cytidylyltransferase [Ureibacillus chungkukjangi]